MRFALVARLAGLVKCAPTARQPTVLCADTIVVILEQLNVERHANMTAIVESLIVDLLEWIGPNARLYSEVIEVWRTSCPRLPVWEEASERGFVVSQVAPGRETVSVTELGAEYVRTHRHASVAG